MIVRRGDIFYADLSPVVGSEQGGIRPVLIIQNDIGNKYSPTVICAAITSQINKAKLPTHIELDSKKYCLIKDSVILLEQIRTVDKKRLKEKICHLEEGIMNKVDKSLQISFGLENVFFIENIPNKNTNEDNHNEEENTDITRCRKQKVLQSNE